MDVPLIDAAAIDDPATAGVALYRAAVEDAAGIACSGFGVQRISRRVEGRALDSFAAVFIDEGAGWLETTAAGRQRIAAPVLFWLHPRAVHSYGPDAGTAWHEWWVLFGGQLAEGFAGAGLLDAGHPVNAIGDGVELAELFGTLHRDFLDAHPLGAHAAGATVHRLIVRAARLAAGTEIAGRRGDLAGATEALRRRAFTVLDLTALAHEFGFSPATFRRQMHKAHGVSPKALLMQTRIARAKELLATSELSIEAVARQAGFEDPYYFSRVFAHRERLSPSEFRRLNQRS